MKLHFGPKDSIYTVFKTIKKVPPYKAVTLSFAPDHPLFENDWRGVQLKDTIQEHNLNTTIQVTNGDMKKFFERQELATVFKHKNLFQKRVQQIHTLIFTTQKLHTTLIFKKSYVSYLVIFSEVTVIVFILYFFWGLISPNATIDIKPAHNIETIVYNYAYTPASSGDIASAGLTIPYHEGIVSFDHRMTLNVQNIQYSTEEAAGKVMFFNTTNEPISLLPQTTLVTPTGVVFKTDAKVTIPPGSSERPGKVSIGVTSIPYTESGKIIGDLGNISKDTVLRIEKLPRSIDTQEIYATAIQGFQGGKTYATGSVIANDIDIIEEKILTFMEDKKKEVLQNSVLEKEHVILLYDNFIKLVIEEFITTSHIGDSTSFIEGEVKAHINYYFIKSEDLTDAVDTYLAQRSSSNYTLLDHDFNSVTLYDIHKETEDGTIYIPTKLNAVRGYNFEDDVNNLVQEMKAKITGKKQNQVKDILLEYAEIDDVIVSISPPWYDSLPDVSSRIKFRVMSE